jgi:hypothetical protein
LRAIRSGIGDQCSGDVIAIASALLDGVSVTGANINRLSRIGAGSRSACFTSKRALASMIA